MKDASAGQRFTGCSCVSGGNLAAVLERAVDTFHEQTMQRRFAKKKASCKPREIKRKARQAKARSRYIPRAVVREVHERDGGQCAFVSNEGKRCEARGFLELHHLLVPERMNTNALHT